MTQDPAQSALEMLDAFASIGARQFDITLTDVAGDKVKFISGRSLGQLRLVLSDILRQATKRRHNVIVRPRGNDAVMIQLDDLDEATAALLRPLSFLVFRTSPGNYQAWVAVADAAPDFAQ